jgi:hypothetical protein
VAITGQEIKQGGLLEWLNGEEKEEERRGKRKRLVAKSSDLAKAGASAMAALTEGAASSS